MRDSGDAVWFSATQFGPVRTYAIFCLICVWRVMPCLVPFYHVRDKVVTNKRAAKIKSTSKRLRQ